MKERVYLIDASIYIFRAWFSYPQDISDTDGHVVNAVHGFGDFLTGLLRQLRPGYIACAFDGSLASSYRNEIYPSYKANREPAPAELKYQFDRCRALTRALGIAEYSSDRYEADDILATMAAVVRTSGHPVTVITSDKDLTQILQHGEDRWWDYARKNELDHEGVEDKFGVRPAQIADFLALAGDSVDNIPGVPGIGSKTAAGLLQQFNDLDGIFENIDQVMDCGLRGASRIRKLLIKHESDARLAQQLTQVFERVPIKATPSCLRWQGINATAIENISADLGFSHFRRKAWLNMPAV